MTPSVWLAGGPATQESIIIGRANYILRIAMAWDSKANAFSEAMPEGIIGGALAVIFENRLTSSGAHLRLL